MCADGNTRAALPRLFLRVGIMAHEWICSRSGGRIHAAPCACGTPREELWRGCDRISWTRVTLVALVEWRARGPAVKSQGDRREGAEAMAGAEPTFASAEMAF
jgi:hypothetical protein